MCDTLTVDPPETFTVPPVPDTLTSFELPRSTVSLPSTPEMSPSKPVLVSTVVASPALPAFGSMVALPDESTSLSTVTPSVLV